MSVAVFLLQALLLEFHGRHLGLQADPCRILRDLRHALETLLLRLEVDRLFVGGVQGDALRLHIDQFALELLDRRVDRRRGAHGHEILLLILPIETVVLLLHLLLGRCETLTQPVEGLPGGLHALVERIADVDVGDAISPKRRLDRVLVRDLDVSQTALRYRLYRDIACEQPGGIAGLLEGALVFELQLINHLVGNGFRLDDLELCVVEVGVLPVAPAAHESFVDAHEEGDGRLDLHHRLRLILGHLQVRH